MKKHIYILLLLLPSFVYSQFELYLVEQRPCATDSSTLVWQPENYEIYQTENDSLDGPKVNNCISLNVESPQFFIEPGNVIFEKKLFIKSLAENTDDYLRLVPNNMLNAEISYNNVFDIENTFVTFTTSQPTLDNIEKIKFKDFRIKAYDQWVSTCIPSGKFDTDQYLTSVVFETQIKSGDFDKNIPLPWLDIYDTYFMTIDYDETDISFGEVVNDSVYQFYWSNIFYLPSFVLHTQEGFPSETNWTYHSLNPGQLENPSEIEVIMEEFAPIYFQEYTSFIGAQFNDSIRHTINLKMSDVSYCLSIIELVTEKGNTLTLSKGSSIEMAGETACIMMKPESSIVIDDDHDIVIGKDGNGILAMKRDAQLILKNNASLTFGGKFYYLNYYNHSKPKIILEKGSHLEFTTEAYFVHEFLEDEGEVDIYMNGGTLDMSELAPEEKEKINLIYPEVNDSTIPFMVYPNPTSDYLRLSPSEVVRSFTLTGIRGNVVMNGTLRAGQYFIDIGSIQAGYYILNIKDEISSQTAKVVKL